jgi:hypothetical protein
MASSFRIILKLLRSRACAPEQARHISVEQPGIGYANLRAMEPNTPSASLPANCPDFEVSLANQTGRGVDGEAQTRASRRSSLMSAASAQTAASWVCASMGVTIGRRAQTDPWSRPVQVSPRQP